MRQNQQNGVILTRSNLSPFNKIAGQDNPVLANIFSPQNFQQKQPFGNNMIGIGGQQPQLSVQEHRPVIINGRLYYIPTSND